MTGPAVTLRRVARSDAAELIEAHARTRANGPSPFWDEPFADMDGFDAWFAQTLAGPAVRLVAVEPGSGAIRGVVTVSQIVLGALRSAYLGYYGLAGFERRGLMTEAVREAVAFAFDELGLHRVEANIQPDNAASIALVRRLGFRLEGFSPRYLKIGGEWRDHERWALLADEGVRRPASVAGVTTRAARPA